MGRSVLTEGSTVTIDDKTGKGGLRAGNAAATSVKVEIVTPGGQVVDTVELAAQGPACTCSTGSSKYAGSTDGLRFRSRHQRQHPGGNQPRWLCQSGRRSAGTVS